MSKGQMLRVLVKQRLTAAAEEIFGLFERTIAEYEEELCRSREENERQRELLDAVFKPQLRLHRADVQPFLVSEEDIPPELQDWRSSLNQEDPTDIKQELWTSQEEEQIQWPEEAEFTFTPVPAKSEDGEEEKPHSSQLHQTDHRKTEAGGEDCGGPEPARNSDPHGYLQPDTDDTTEDSCESQLGLNYLKNKEGFNASNRLFCVSEYGKRFSQQVKLKSHRRVHSAEKRFSCSLCSKRFTRKATLDNHMKTHTGEKSHHCSFCTKRFSRYIYLQSHVRTHTGEKPYSCSLCNKCFTQHTHLQLHKRIHTGEKPYSCTICDKRFTWPTQLKRHKCGGDHHELWANQETSSDLISVTSGPVESADGDEEKPQTSQLHQMNR